MSTRILHLDGFSASLTDATLGDSYTGADTVIPNASYVTCPGEHGGTGMLVTGPAVSGDLTLEKALSPSEVSLGFGLRVKMSAGAEVFLQPWDEIAAPPGPAALSGEFRDYGDGTASFDFFSAGTIVQSGPRVLFDPDKWYFLEFRWNRREDWEGRVNGARAFFRDLTTTLPDVDLNRVRLIVKPNGGQVCVDDFYITSNDDSDVKLRMYGPKYVVQTQVPAANGNATEWTAFPGVQANYGTVDDAATGSVDDDASYVYSSKEEDLDLYALSGSSRLGGTVVGSQIQITARKDSVAAESIPVVSLSRGLAEEVDNIPLSDSYERYVRSYRTRPGGSRAFSPEDLRNWQLGIGDASRAGIAEGATGIGNYNVVFFYLDDWGIDHCHLYHDENFYQTSPALGNTPLTLQQAQEGLLYAKMPILQELAADGVIFNQFRATPVCSAGRWTWLTGRLPHRHGCGSIAIKRPPADLYETGQAGWEETTIADVIRPEGYRSGFIGKCHMMNWDNLTVDAEHGGPTTEAADATVGVGWNWLVQRSGFDHFSATFHNLAVQPRGRHANSVFRCSNNYWVYSNPTTSSVGTTGSEEQIFGYDLDAGGDPLGGTFVMEDWDAYVTGRQTNDAISFISDNVNEKFLCYVAYNAPHNPHNPPPEGYYHSDPSLKNFISQGDSKGYSNHFNFQLMLEAIDISMGQVRDFLRDNHPAVYERTVFVIAGDNGSPSQPIQSTYSVAANYNTMVALGGTLEQGPGGGIEMGTIYNDMATDPNSGDVGTAPFKRGIGDRGNRCPLIIANPGALIPAGTKGTTSEAQVNVCDIFALVADLAGADASAVVPPERLLDAVSPLPVVLGLADETTHLRQHSTAFIFTSNDINTMPAPQYENTGYTDATRTSSFAASHAFRHLGILWKIHIYLNDLVAVPKYEYEFYEMAVDPAELNDLLIGGLSAPQQTAYDFGLAQYQAMVDSEPRINGGVTTPGEVEYPFTDAGGFDAIVRLDIDNHFPFVHPDHADAYVDTDGVLYRFANDTGGEGVVRMSGAPPTGDLFYPFDGGGKVVKLTGVNFGFVHPDEPSAVVVTDGIDYPLKDEDLVDRVVPLT
jgi:arylsulfatase A-like enzyme